MSTQEIEALFGGLMALAFTGLLVVLVLWKIGVLGDD